MRAACSWMPQLLLHHVVLLAVQLLEAQEARVLAFCLMP